MREFETQGHLTLAVQKRGTSVMTGPNKSILTIVYGVLIVASVGCLGGLEPVDVPQVDAEAAASGAMEMYDKNGDGKLSAEEVAQSPALKASQSIDQNKDKIIEKEELVRKFSKWATSGIGASTFACRVTHKGQPLKGARVEFVPEEYLQDAFQPAEGTTNRKGIASMGIDSSFLPDDLQRLQAVHQGLYRVVITHPSVDIPSKYNTNTELGLEITFGLSKDFVPFNLKD